MSRGMALLYGGPPKPGTWRSEDSSEFGKNAKPFPEDMVPPFVSTPEPESTQAPTVDPRIQELLQTIQSGVVTLRLNPKSKLSPEDRAKLDEIVGQITALKHVLGV